MSTQALNLYLDGTLCGAVEQTPSGNLTFRYDEPYRKLPDPTPLSLSMPLSVAVHKKRSILPFLQGLLPDNEEALRAIARRFGVSVNSPFAMLEQIGSDVAGAVQIVRPGVNPTDETLSRKNVRAVTDTQVALMLDHVVDEYAEGTPYSDAAGRFSLAGAQPKIALHQLPDGAWGVPEDATPTTHILKPATGPFSRLDVVEQMTMHAARALGNDVAQSELVRFGKWDVFVTKRYDRVLAKDGWRRTHQEDLCQALAVSPSKKYQHRDGGPGAADIASLVRTFPFESERREVGRKFYRAFVFNIVAGCTDAHAKNYSFLLDGNSVRLAPLYDLASYAAYWDGTSRIDSSMSVGGEYSLDRISVIKLAALGSRFGLSADDAAQIVDSTRTGVVAAFESGRSMADGQGEAAQHVADDLISMLKKLPLVIG
ncbi:HipA domain-containing protein [Specibacter cremeus]|uniref:HipA domain-containing protein n=1 Tax=Specibacter cremeus TaxID=1629051 RepID=UPI0013DE788A|nr:HipA domain-containing protein [Specibacter cremeus]